MRILIYLFVVLSITSTKAQSWIKTKGVEGGEIENFQTNESILVLTVKSKGLFMSTDFGAQWNCIIQKPIADFFLNGNDLVAVARDSLYFSTDNCNSFLKRHFPYNYYGAKIYYNKGIIYAFSYMVQKISSDTGKTWTNITYNFKLMSQNDTVWYCDYNGFSKSYNKGQTWEQDTVIKNSVRAIVSEGLKAWVVANNRLYYTYNAGQSWTIILEGGYPYAMNMVRRVNNVLYVSDQSNIIRSFNNGLSWDTLPANQPYSALVHTNFCIAGNYYFKAGNGIHVSTDGINWQRSNKGLLFSRISKLYSRGNMLVSQQNSDAGYYSQELAFSIDFGDTWRYVTQCDSPANGWFSSDFDQGRLVATNSHFGTYLSTDYGNQWSHVGQFNSFAASGDTYIKDSTIIVSVSGHLKVSNDLGKSWFDTYPFPSYQGYYASIASSDKYLLCARQYLYQSSDKGKSWTKVNCPHNISDHLVYSGKFFYGFGDGNIVRIDENISEFKVVGPQKAALKDIAAKDNFVCVVGVDTIYLSFDCGDTWIKTGFPFPVTSVAISLPYVFLGTKDEAIWRSELPSAGIQDKEKQTDFPMAFPNPFSVSVTFRVPEKYITNSILELFDLFGKKVLQEKISSGEFKIINKGLNCGVYMYQLTNDRKEIIRGKLIMED